MLRLDRHDMTRAPVIGRAYVHEMHEEVRLPREMKV